MRIKKFSTKNNQVVKLGDFTVLVGPNNTGKSQTLSDIHSIMNSPNTPDSVATTIVSDLEYGAGQFDEFKTWLDIRENPNNVDQRIIRGIGSNLQQTKNQQLRQAEIEQLQEAEDITEHRRFHNLTQFKVALLDASSRLTIATSTDTYDISEAHPQNILQKLYTSPRARERLRSAFRNTFSKDILLDYSSLRKFSLRIADDFGENEKNLLGPPENHSSHKRIDDQGAGYRSFAGVVLSLLLTEDRVVLLDEPEAFLHPAQARQFGSWMANHANDIPGQLIISTHNSHFLTGILTGSNGIAIHRLNRVDDFTKYNSMPSEVTSELSSDPLLSNQRVTEGVFYKGVVVCEADSDALIYRYTSEVEFDESDFLFTHAHNKQTISRITRVLTEAAIPRVAIADIDLLKEPRKLRELLQSLDDSSRGYREISNKCNHFNQALRESDEDWNGIKSDGRDAIPETAEEHFEEIYSTARGVGLFIVDAGELEGWLNLDVSKGPEWVISALDEIDAGNSSESLNGFVQEVREYLNRQYRDLVVAVAE